jgi:hypothetical protein
MSSRFASIPGEGKRLEPCEHVAQGQQSVDAIHEARR